MQKLLLQFQELKRGQSVTKNPYFNQILDDFSFYLFENEDLDIKIFEKSIESKIIIIDKFEFQSEHYLIFCFDQTLIVIDKNIQNQIKILFERNHDSFIYILKNEIVDLFDHDFIFFTIDECFMNEIFSFLKTINFLNEKNLFWKFIQASIAGFLIQKSYKKSIIDRTRTQSRFDTEFEQIEINTNNFIEMKNFQTGGTSVQMIYHIEKQKFFVLKSFFDDEKDKLSNRECQNYSNIHHPYLLKSYGTSMIKSNNVLILEYFNGVTITDMKRLKFTLSDKIDVIFKLIIVLNYLHNQGYIYRDLKPNNVMVNKSKGFALIDLDRMIKNDQKSIDSSTVINTIFLAPEIGYGLNYSYSADVYSLGLLIYYIIYEEKPSSMIIQNKLENNKDQNTLSLCKIIQECINTNPFKRPSLADLFDFFMQIYQQFDINSEFDYYKLIFSFQNKEDNNINKTILNYSLAASQNDPKAQLNLGLMYAKGEYVEHDMNKAIHFFLLAAKHNEPDAQFNLGVIYAEGEYVARDITKAIHYYTLAANHNYPDAQFNLGVIYSTGQYTIPDIGKAIHYYTLAANQNYPDAQFNLGLIYANGEYETRDIDKAIHYFTLAANQNHLLAQLNLGIIYSEGEYVTRDINKTIYYYTLAANQNDPDAQFNLGLIYAEAEHVKRDIDKAIHYYTLAANQNHLQAQFNLAVIYSEGKYLTRDINKAIYYYTLAAHQNDSDAQINLGVIYAEGKYITRDIYKAIHYYTLAADQNNSQAQFNLGSIYLEGQYVARDINKAINYYTLAANQNHSNAEFNLGTIYEKGKYTKRDIEKAIYYYTLSASHHNPYAQNNLGQIYNKGEYINRDINKAIFYYSLAANQDHRAQLNLGYILYSNGNIKKGIYNIILASNKGNKLACFLHGFLLHEGKKVKGDISKAIHYYKEASSFNIEYAKNNLGIIYKNGFMNIEKNIGLAIGYFKEAIRQRNDFVSMYNLAHIYIYGPNKKSIDKPIKLLIRSSSFKHSIILLSILLVKQFGNDIEAISGAIEKQINTESNVLSKIKEFIYDLELYDTSILESLYEIFRSFDFLYNIQLKPIFASDLMDKDEIIPKYPLAKNISSEFYNGLGIDIIIQ